MDLNVPSFMKDEGVIYNGKVQQETYGDMQKEMGIFNTAFAKVMEQGDSKGRVFTFPIPILQRYKRVRLGLSSCAGHL